MSGATKTEWTLKIPNGMCSPYLEIPIEAIADGLIIGSVFVSWDELEEAKLRARGEMDE